MFGSHGLKSDVLSSIYWNGNPEGYSSNLTTLNIKDVTKIDVCYYNYKNVPDVVACIVFYNGETIIGAP